VDEGLNSIGLEGLNPLNWVYFVSAKHLAKAQPVLITHNQSPISREKGCIEYKRKKKKDLLPQQVKFHLKPNFKWARHGLGRPLLRFKTWL
jgi:hypothetical protein